jgi:hypothetical protein
MSLGLLVTCETAADCPPNFVCAAEALGFGVCELCPPPGRVDACGVCDEDKTNDCAQDCAGEYGGTAIADLCGICGGELAPENKTSDTY